MCDLCIIVPWCLVIIAGIFLDMIEDLHISSTDPTTFILQFDGKLMKSQLTNNQGDADYAGMEVPSISIFMNDC